jgi:hypothetical protein
MVRVSLVGVALGALLAAPLVAAVASGLPPVELLASGVTGFVAAVDAVGWVLVPQIGLAVAVVSLALQKLACRVAGLGAQPTPAWLDPAVESALLLGMLGTIHGMVSGFVGLTPDELEPGPLVYGLGTALRSSFVGFLIALVGVWVKAHREDATVFAPGAERSQPA